MQSMFRLPWSSEPPGDKIMEKATAFHKSHQVPYVDFPLMSKLKRKRTDSPEPANAHAHVVKKLKNANGEVKPAAIENGSVERAPVVDGFAPEEVKPANSEGQTASVSGGNPDRPKKEGVMRVKASKAQKPSATVHDSTPVSTATMENTLTPLQQKIEAQFNYEILLKHNELRLIEQELAKCQVALEQLRRCQLIPFPGSQTLSENVSGGVGAALRPSRGNTEPRHAAPWGVTDGPYTRHYAKWLISDPKFDSVPEHAQAHYFGSGEGRATRGGFSEYLPSSRARTSRTSTGTIKLQALGENPAPAPKVDPLLHKRSTDGQWVRLYCAMCGHSQFSNTQGFLNHCRIKHNQIFKSHDAAAIACGVPVNPDEVGAQLTNSEPASATTVTTPAASLPVFTTPGAVHPLIRSNPTETARVVHRDFTTPKSTRGTADRHETSPKKSSEAPFVPAPSTPYMNALLEKRGFPGNYKQMVDTARTHVDMDSLENSDDELAESVAHTPVNAHSKSTAGQLARHPMAKKVSSSKSASARPGSKKGPSNANVARLPFTSLHSPVNVNGSDHHMPDSPVDLSPNTVESNPGLVSDHDDDDDEDGDDARSEPHMGHAVDFVIGDDVVVEDASDVEGTQESKVSRKGLNGCFRNGEGSRKK